MVIREKYLKIIRPFYKNEMIKVLIGIRRSGKSVLLNQIIEELKTKNSVSPSNILYINFEDYSYQKLTNTEEFYKYVENWLENKTKNLKYLFFDEIQEVKNFEKVINSFRATHKDISIFITGSNSKLLSGKLATYLGGRTLSFKIYPFTFSEFLELEDDFNNLNSKLEIYFKWGGFPLVCKSQSSEEKRVQLLNLYDSIIMQDIISASSFGQIDTMKRILTFILGNTSLTVSPETITKELGKVGIKVSIPTVYEYLQLFEDAGIVNLIQRYDIRSKQILKTLKKAYSCDLGLFELTRTRANSSLGSIIETLVLQELKSRGLNVYVGKTYKGEVDFIAEKIGLGICYIQVSYIMESKKTIEREFGAFSPIKNNCPKYVISTDPVNLSQNGIIHLKLIDFLLDEELLQFRQL